MQDSILEAFEHMTGFIIVMMTLGILWAMTALVGTIIQNLERRKLEAKAGASAPVSPPPAAQALPVPTASGELSEEEVAVIIAATVSMALPYAHRIVSIKPASSDWSREGRRQIFSSHKIR